MSKPIGAFRRLLLVLVGGATVIAGVGSAGVIVVLWAGAVLDDRHADRMPLQGAPVVLAVVALFGAFAVMGATRVVAGLRGHTTPSAPFGARPERWIRRHWYVFGLVGWGAVTAFATAMSARAATSPLTPGASSRLAWLILAGYLVLPLHVAVHELGHALAGALVGFRFASLRVGPLALTREAGGLRFSWRPMELADVLGWHAAIPERPDGLAVRLAIHAAAGPITTGATALACLAASQALGPSTSAGTIVADLLWAGFWVGAALGTLNAVPFRTASGVLTDGARFLESVRRSPPAGSAALMFRCLWATGRRPRAWGVGPAYFVDAAAGAGTAREQLLLAGAAVALDTGERTRGAEILRVALAEAPSDAPMRRELELQAAMVEGFGGDAASARERLTRAGCDLGSEWYVLLAEAVVRFAELRLADAREALDGWERAVAATGRAESVRVGNEWAVEELRARLGSPGR